jgi:hypothetical protein
MGLLKLWLHLACREARRRGGLSSDRECTSEPKVAEIVYLLVSSSDHLQLRPGILKLLTAVA